MRTSWRSFRSALAGFGPGLLVTAAFIGPGTVTTASRAGAAFGTALLWAVAFSTLATIVLQEMSARLGLVTRQGLGEAIRSGSSRRGVSLLGCGLVLTAILFGNAAYQTGNLMGAALGADLLCGGGQTFWVAVIGGLAAVLLWTARYRLIQGVLVALVVGMTAVFLATAMSVHPSAADVWRGLLRPTIPDRSLVVVVGLIGTTIVPYNLFLHASAALQRWPETVSLDKALQQSRRDAVVSIALGGLVTAAIVVTGAAVQAQGGVATAADMAAQLAPLLGGRAARVLFAAGMFAAGLTSAITAPLAAAYATAGIFGARPVLADWRLRGVSLGVLAAGLGMAVAWGHSPTEAILLAQVANGLLLPIVALFLLIAVNQRRRMQSHANGPVSNALGFVVVGLAAALGAWHILTRLGVVG